ncbi:MAG TPA: CHAD domain-containing protein [Candidatus Cybelea sp.]|nr:CHAD domain-containing protein [Candidatus Cybelea sp.]
MSKPERIELHGVADPGELMARVLAVRSRELGRLQGALQSGEGAGLHDFRIACKRLRYALERFEKVEPSLAPIAQSLSRLQDALGAVHDRDVLASILPPALEQAERKLHRERTAFVEQAVALWAQTKEKARVCTLILFE